MTRRVLLLALCGALAVGCGDDDGGGMDAGRDSAAPPMDSGRDSATPPSDSGIDAAVTPTPRGRDNPPTLGVQIDRMGRPAVSTATVGTFMPDGAARDDLKDGYNANADPSTWVSMYRDGIADMIAILDGADTVCGNQLGYDASAGVASAYDFLAALLADDRLIIDSTTGMCPEYLGYEAEVLGVVSEGGCGGRTPNHDVVDRSYSVLINGSLGDLGDAVDGDNVTHDENTFPFLAAP